MTNISRVIKDSNSTILTNIWCPWITINEIEACLYIYWGFHIICNYLHFLLKVLLILNSTISYNVYLICLTLSNYTRLILAFACGGKSLKQVVRVKNVKAPKLQALFLYCPIISTTSIFSTKLVVQTSQHHYVRALILSVPSYFKLICTEGASEAHRDFL